MLLKCKQKNSNDLLQNNRCRTPRGENREATVCDNSASQEFQGIVSGLFPSFGIIRENAITIEL